MITDPDLLNAVIAERHHAQPVTPPAPKDVRAARNAVHDPVACISGVLWRPMIAPDIAKFTGLQIGVVCASLIELEGKGMVRRTGERGEGWDGRAYDLWERVLA